MTRLCSKLALLLGLLALLLSANTVLAASSDTAPRSFAVYLSDYSAFLASPSPELLASGEMPSDSHLAQMRADWDTLPFPLPREDALYADTKLQIVIRGDSLTYQLRYTISDTLIRFILPAALPDESISPIGTVAMEGAIGQIYPGSEGSTLSVFFDGTCPIRVNFYVDAIPEGVLDGFVLRNPIAASTASPTETSAVPKSASCQSQLSAASLLPILLLPFGRKRRRG